MASIRYESAGGIIIQDGRMLILDRPSRGEKRLPKGHIEPGERPVAAALRETQEETGFTDLAILADLGSQVVEFDYAGDHYVRTEHYYLMTLESSRREPRNPKDAAQFKPEWIAAETAQRVLTFPAEQESARRAWAAYRRHLGRSS